MDNMKPAEIEAVIKFARIGMWALSTRGLTWAAFAGALAAFGGALYSPDWTRSAIAAGYAILVLWPILRFEKNFNKE